MAQEYTITGVYPATVKATGEQRSFEAHGNKLLVWRLFFEGQDGYFLTNRQEGNDPKKGDVVYGTIDADRFGNPTFKSESRPLGELPARKAEATVSSGLEEKVDYLIGLVEALAENQGIKQQDVVLEDIDEKPIDLADIPF